MSVSESTPPPSAVQRAAVFLEAIKFSHSVFALPFALTAMLVAAKGLPSAWDATWIVIACVAARTTAMAFNRLADRAFDERNPRTVKRALVTGALNERHMAAAMAIGAVIFLVASAMLNGTCLVLAPPVLGILCFYSLTKRFTNYSHFVLGFALALAPVGAWIAIRESLELAPVVLGAAVLTWVSGFDILYSCQDFEIDSKDDALHSVPKRLGIAGAMRLSKRVHKVSVLLLLLFWAITPLGLPSLVGIALVAGLLMYQHRLVSPDDLSRIDAAFFTANGLVSLIFLGLVTVDLLAG